MNPVLAFAFHDELEKLALAGVGRALSGSIPKGSTSVKALATASMKMPKPVMSRSGGVVKFRSPSIKPKNIGHANTVSPKGVSKALSTPSIKPKAPLNLIG